jgi:hypothetical protein
MYALDPDQGRRRRAMAADKAVHSGHQTAEEDARRADRIEGAET